MEVNDEHIDSGFDDDDENSPWYSPPWKIYDVTHAMENVTAKEINDFHLGKRDDIKVVEFDNEELQVLNSFGSYDFTFFATTNEHYCERHNFLKSLGFEREEKYLDIILVLLKCACWGLPQSDFAEREVRHVQKTENSLKKANKKIPLLRKLLRLLTAEKNVMDETEIYGRSNIPLKYRLEKVTFSFVDKEDPSAKNMTIQIKTEANNRNPVGNFIASYYEMIKSDKVKFFKDLGLSILSQQFEKDEVFSAYKIFCYRFIQFLETKTSLTQKKLGSRNEQFVVYHKLLEKAGYGINIQTVRFNGIQDYLRKWYSDGKNLEKKNFMDVK